MQTICWMVQGAGVKIRSLSLGCELQTVSSWRTQYSQAKLEGMCFNCSWPLPSDFSGFVHGEQSMLVLLRGTLCFLWKWHEKVLTSSLYIWHQILTWSVNTKLRLSLKDFSECLYNEVFSIFKIHFHSKFICCLYQFQSLEMRSRWKVFIILNRLTTGWRVMLHSKLRDFTQYLTELLSQLILTYITVCTFEVLISLEGSPVY